MFQLTKVEYNNLRFQIETTNMSRTLPYAFTEQGVAMLASVLKTKVAEEASVKIMDAFAQRKGDTSTKVMAAAMALPHNPGT